MSKTKQQGLKLLLSSGETHCQPLKGNFQGLAPAKTLGTFQLAHEQQGRFGQSTHTSSTDVNPRSALVVWSRSETAQIKP